jgi:Ca-activated chloride channel family protein
MPQARPVAYWRPAAVLVTGVSASVSVHDQVATTVLTVDLRNPASTRQEAELLVPVPDDAVVKGFDFEGAGKEPSAVLLPKDEAKRTYESIVAKVRDPALLEFIGWNLVRSSVFPVEPGGTQKIRLTYEQVLEVEGGRADFVLPRSESVDYGVPWKITVQLRSQAPMATIYSPSHEVDVVRRSATEATVTLRPDAGHQPGPFRLSYLLEQGGVAASVMAYPDPKVGGGYFLLLAGAQGRGKDGGKTVSREVTLVLDRSGSMAGEKLDQAKAAVRQVLGGLEDGEHFNLVVYNEGVDAYAPEPVVKSTASLSDGLAWMDSVTARGGTNIHDSLVEALRPKPLDGTLPIVLFTTDGLPTIGQTSEAAIRAVASQGNPHGRRVFTFGVGLDVNTPLLEALAEDTRGLATFVLPEEDVEVKVARVFKALSGPVLSDPVLTVETASGEAAPGRVREVLPARLPDLFEDDRLVVLGQYLKDEPLTFVVQGNYRGSPREFRMTCDFSKATTRNGFVPRLWASRKIASLVDAIRRSGADTTFSSDIERIAADPRFRELVDEIVRLSREFGILTEYTAFLAREGTDLDAPEDNAREARENLLERAVKTRSGMGSVSQSINSQAQLQQEALNPRNAYYDERMNMVSTNAVQQVANAAFFRRGSRWVESSMPAGGAAAPARVVEFGSAEFGDLAVRLASEGRQGAISLRGDILLTVDGESVLVRAGVE